MGCPTAAVIRRTWKKGDRIDLELGWAENLGLNTLRVSLHNLVWEREPGGTQRRIDKLLKLVEKHKMRVIFVLFDSLGDPYPELGRQHYVEPVEHIQFQMRARVREADRLELRAIRRIAHPEREVALDVTQRLLKLAAPEVFFDREDSLQFGGCAHVTQLHHGRHSWTNSTSGCVCGATNGPVGITNKRHQ